MAHPAAADSYSVTTTADDRWVADARARAGAGRWERDADQIFAELRKQAVELQPTAPALPGCPACPTHPAMLNFPRHELITTDPFLYCQACYGFWAVGDALSRGVSDPGYIHPALESAPAPRRCKECFGHLKPNNECAKCGKSPALLNCPLCSKPMDRSVEKGISLDHCGPCRGTWFDTGEIVATHGLEPPQGLAMSTVDEHASDDEPPGWLLALQVLGRMFLPFFPL